MIPVGFLTRYAVPFIVAVLYLGDADIQEQIAIFDKTMRLTDETLFKAKREGEGNERYDFIVVGAGSAGALLANRLTASGLHRVLLLEAGGDPNPITDIPFGQTHFLRTSIMDWGYRTVPQNRSCRNADGYCRFNRGKALGGSSSIHGMVYNRCMPKDYDFWATFTGDDSWSWANIKETYNSFEDYRGYYEEEAGDGRHGFEGEVHVSATNYFPGAEVFEEAAREKGYYIGDLNGGDQQQGFGKLDRTIKEGLRVGTYQAFLEPVLDRSNLVIYRYALATKIETEMDGDGLLRATGVTYERHGATFTAWADKEVLISGGVIESPKLLMLSGLGPREHLEELGIETLLDLPAVGQHLDDHISSATVTGDDGGFRVNTTFGVDRNTTDAVLQYLHNGTGPSTAFFNTILMGYTNSRQNDDVTWPDIQNYIYSSYNVKSGRQDFAFSSTLMRQSSRGTVKLASKNPEDKPIVDPNFFADPADMERVVDGIENVLDIYLNSAAFKRYDIQPMGRYAACDELEHFSRDFWKCYVRLVSQPDYHPTSTCRMGPNSSVAVTDSKLKVFGTSNLRVIDASAFPSCPSGNTHLPAMLVGARGAEIILSEQ